MLNYYTQITKITKPENNTYLRLKISFKFQVKTE